MRHDYAHVARANIPRSTFNLSRVYKTTFDAGLLIPLDPIEVVPGDTHSVTMNVFARLATPIHPIMDNLWIESFFFFVPNRLVWDNWQKFMGEQQNPNDSTDYTIPGVGVSTNRTFGDPTNKLYEYFGLPTIGQINEVTTSGLPFRGYNLIYNEWFRDENLQNAVVVEKGNVPSSILNIADYVCLRRGKRHDYFTSCLPWPQKGPGVDLPLGDTAPVKQTPGDQFFTVKSDDLLIDVRMDSSGAAVESGPQDPDGIKLVADLGSATAATINDLRQAFQIQKLQERDARGGTRYQELVLAHFGVRGGDARLNRPEYLGGGTHPVGITQVPQTSETQGPGTPQGNLSAYGTSGGASGFTKSFTEHGYIIPIINARADITYQRGMDRHWSRQTKYDFYWPALAKIGEQAVLNKEIFHDGSADDDLVFGYQERFAEMRTGNAHITGLFRSTATGSLDPWHLSQDFASLPALNDTFIQDDPPVDRVIAVQDEPHFLFDAYLQHKAVRPMPVDAAPGYIDHF